MKLLGIFFIALPFIAILGIMFREIGLKYMLYAALSTLAIVSSIYLGCYLLNGHV